MSRERKTSIRILNELHNSLYEVTKAGRQTYENYANDPSTVNGTIMSSVYAYLVIRAAAFLDELETQFEKHHYAGDHPPLNKAIAHYKKLFKSYRVKDLRNYTAHNRKKAGKKGTPYKHKYITDADLKKFRKLSSPAIFDAFAVASEQILIAIGELPQPARKRTASKRA